MERPAPSGSPCYNACVRLVIAECSVAYEGRLGARLAPARRLIVMKADGSIAIHSDSKAYKPLNWMNPPCTITEADGVDHRRSRPRASGSRSSCTRS